MHSIRKLLNHKKSHAVAVALGGAVVLEQSASADVSAVTGALTAVGTDAATLGAAVLVVIVAVMAFKYLRKAL
ncbi:major capsid protein [Methylovulum psychrotolerans]|nr:major capsid protein [Methylovulum psychrotolerans]